MNRLLAHVPRVLVFRIQNMYVPFDDGNFLRSCVESTRTVHDICLAQRQTNRFLVHLSEIFLHLSDHWNLPVTDSNDDILISFFNTIRQVEVTPIKQQSPLSKNRN